MFLLVDNDELIFSSLVAMKAYSGFRSIKQSFSTTLQLNGRIEIKMNIQMAVEQHKAQKRDTYNNLLKKLKK